MEQAILNNSMPSDIRQIAKYSSASNTPHLGDFIFTVHASQRMGPHWQHEMRSYGVQFSYARLRAPRCRLILIRRDRLREPARGELRTCGRNGGITRDDGFKREGYLVSDVLVTAIPGGQEAK